MSASVEQPDADSTDGAKSGGVDVVTGFVKMSGATEVTCAIKQLQGTDHAIIDVSAIAECKTKAPLKLVVETPSRADGDHLDVGLPEREQKTFPSFPFPLPAAGALVRTTLTAKCTGAGDKVVWGTGRCTVPSPRLGGGK
jgi:hypothetical protein